MSAIDIISSPVESIKGSIKVPGDKSISHRAVMLAAIAKGTTTINGFLSGNDCLATIRAFKSMGVAIDGPVNDRLIVHGAGKYGLKAPVGGVVDCENSGTTMRLLSGLLAAQKFDSTLIGDASLSKRPMERVSLPLLQMGACITTTDGKPPLAIRGNHPLKGITYQMPQDSAQVKSCLLLAGLYAEGETTILEKNSSRDHTERMLSAFSYPISKLENGVSINSENELKAVDVIVPGDISSATFFIVAATIIPGSDIYINNVGINPTRTGALKILEMMGANIKVSNKRLCGEELVADLRIQHAELEGVDIPSSLVPMAIDEFPILFIAAACARGQTRLHGARELRLKESDRIGVMVDGLMKLGIEAQAFEDGVFIKGGQLQGGEIDSCHDHRIAMAFAIAGCVAAQPIRITGCEHVAVSFPGFVKTAQKLHLNLREVKHESAN